MRKQHFREIDGQGLTREQALTAIDARLRRADGAYRLCAIYAMKKCPHEAEQKKVAVEIQESNLRDMENVGAVITTSKELIQKSTF